MQHDSGENTEYSYFGRTTRKYILERRKPQSVDQFMIFNTHIMQVIIKNKKIDFYVKPLNIQCFLILFCTSPVGQVSFKKVSFEMCETILKICPKRYSPCMYFLPPKNYCLSGFGQNYLKLINLFSQLLNYWIILHLKSYFRYFRLCQGDQILCLK